MAYNIKTAYEEQKPDQFDVPHPSKWDSPKDEASPLAGYYKRVADKIRKEDKDAEDRKKMIQAALKIKRQRAAESVQGEGSVAERIGLMNTGTDDYKRRIRLAEYRSSLIGKPMPEPPPADSEFYPVWKQEEASRQRRNVAVKEADRLDIEGRAAREHNVPTAKDLMEADPRHKFFQSKLVSQTEGPEAGTGTVDFPAEYRKEQDEIEQQKKDLRAVRKAEIMESQRVDDELLGQGEGGSSTYGEALLPRTKKQQLSDDELSSYGGGLQQDLPEQDDDTGYSNNSKLPERLETERLLKKYDVLETDELAKSKLAEENKAILNEKINRENKEFIGPILEKIESQEKEEEFQKAKAEGKAWEKIKFEDAHIGIEKPVKYDENGYPIYKKGGPSSRSFQKAYKDARESGEKEFSWRGGDNEVRDYNTKKEGEKVAEAETERLIDEYDGDAKKIPEEKVNKLPVKQKQMIQEERGTHIKDEGSGYMINMSRIEASIDRKKNMEMLQHIPLENRAAMLYSFGYIDENQLSKSQQKSALQIQQLKNAELLHAKRTVELDQAKKNLKGSLTQEEQSLFSLTNSRIKSASTGDPPNFKLIKHLNNKLSEIRPEFADNVDWDAEERKYYKAKEKQLLDTPGVERVAKAHSVDLKAYRADVSKAMTIAQGKMEGLSGPEALMGVGIKDGDKTTSFGQMLRRSGYPSWEDVKAEQEKNSQSESLIKLRETLGLKGSELIQPQMYMGWAQGKMVDSIMVGIYGHDAHSKIQFEQNKGYKQYQENLKDPEAVDNKVSNESGTEGQYGKKEEEPILKSKVGSLAKDHKDVSHDRMVKLKESILGLGKRGKSRTLTQEEEDAKLKVSFDKGQNEFLKNLNSKIRSRHSKGKVTNTEKRYRTLSEALDYYSKHGFTGSPFLEDNHFKYFILKKLEERDAGKIDEALMKRP